jgi:hypothetical protein
MVVNVQRLMALPPAVWFFRAIPRHGVFRKVCVIGLSNFGLYTMVEAVERAKAVGV